jgi:hypothetical protein
MYTTVYAQVHSKVLRIFYASRGQAILLWIMVLANMRQGGTRYSRLFTVVYLPYSTKYEKVYLMKLSLIPHLIAPVGSFLSASPAFFELFFFFALFI